MSLLLHLLQLLLLVALLALLLLQKLKMSSQLILEDAGAQKIAVIKEVRTFTGLGLKEAKDLVDGAPSTVLEKANKETADKAKAAFEAAGAKVTVK